MAKLFKSKSDIPAWFSSSLYEIDNTSELWLHELVIRYTLKQIHENGVSDEELKSRFTQLIIERDFEDKQLVSAPEVPGEIWGVKELSAYELLYLAEMANSSQKSKNHLKKIQEARNNRDIASLINNESKIEDLKKISFGEMIDWDVEPFHLNDVNPRFPISVDLDQDNETLKFAFEIWLAGVREELGHAKKPFKAKDFEQWSKYCVLQVFDLQLWAQINNGKFTNKLLADTLWPYDEEDTTERVRKVTLKKIDFLLSDWTNIGRLWKQVELEKSIENFIENLESKQ